VLLGFAFERKQILHISVTRRRGALEHPSSRRPVTDASASIRRPVTNHITWWSRTASSRHCIAN